MAAFPPAQPRHAISPARPEAAKTASLPRDAPFHGQGCSNLPLPYGVAGMIPTARVQRGPSEAARCASTGIVLAPRPIFQHPAKTLDPLTHCAYDYCQMITITGLEG